MLGWIVRIFFAIAAPITALFVSRDALNFGLIQTIVTMLLVTALVGLIAAYCGRDSSGPTELNRRGCRDQDRETRRAYSSPRNRYACATR
nr:hypothetical protein FJN17_19625 [Bradyrhizobium symbiodeficiens]